MLTGGNSVRMASVEEVEGGGEEVGGGLESVRTQKKKTYSKECGKLFHSPKVKRYWR